MKLSIRSALAPLRALRPRHLLVAALCASALAPVQAAALLVSAGETIVLNFDFSGQTPPAPYENITVDTGLTGLDGDELGEWRIHGSLDAQGAPLVTATLPSMGFGLSDADILDGMFSIVFEVTAGAVFIDPIAMGIHWDDPQDEWPVVRGAPLTAGVPEPAGWALVMLTAGAAASTRRRRG